MCGCVWARQWVIVGVRCRGEDKNYAAGIARTHKHIHAVRVSSISLALYAIVGHAIVRYVVGVCGASSRLFVWLRYC